MPGFLKLFFPKLCECMYVLLYNYKWVLWKPTDWVWSLKIKVVQVLEIAPRARWPGSTIFSDDLEKLGILGICYISNFTTLIKRPLVYLSGVWVGMTFYLVVCMCVLSFVILRLMKSCSTPQFQDFSGFNPCVCVGYISMCMGKSEGGGRWQRGLGILEGILAVLELAHHQAAIDAELTTNT